MRLGSLCVILGTRRAGFNSPDPSGLPPTLRIGHVEERNRSTLHAFGSNGIQPEPY
jgi:hypothetical protein